MTTRTPPYQRILLPTDGSDGAQAAARTAGIIADRFDADVYVVHVADVPELPPGIAEDFEGEIVETSHQIVTETEQTLADTGVTTHGASFVTGDPIHQVLIHFATSHDIDCIVMGTTGRTGVRRLALGSVAERTVRAAPVPVITVRGDTASDPSFGRILLPTDGSSGAAAAIDHGIELATLTDASISILHVVSLPTTGFIEGAAQVYDALEEVGRQAIEAVRDRANEAGVRQVDASLVSGRIERAIVRHVEDRDADLIVMGTHGRSGFDRLWLGSVTERVIRRSPVPVISVKPPAVLEDLSPPTPEYTEFSR